ncbi:MAG: hypothetical protein MJ074_07120 [Oscillospiraceae bacterium]|nr:hypothetical protein [Oscillospiraceae bacterium]
MSTKPIKHTTTTCSFCGKAIPPNAPFHTVRARGQKQVKNVCMACCDPSRREARR